MRNSPRGRENVKKSKESAVEQAARDAEKHPARPEQYVEGFQTGYDQERDTAEELQGPNFARGVAKEDAPGPPPQGRFSEGIEQDPDETATQAERRFSEGAEKRPTKK